MEHSPTKASRLAVFLSRVDWFVNVSRIKYDLGNDSLQIFFANCMVNHPRMIHVEQDTSDGALWLRLKSEWPKFQSFILQSHCEVLN
jgi:hypothetical protein